MVDLPRLPAITRKELALLGLGILCGLAAWWQNDRAWLSNLLSGTAIALAAGAGGSISSSGGWRAFLGRKRLDPHALVFTERDRYVSILKDDVRAKEAAILGFHLEYLIDWLDCNDEKFFHTVQKLTVLLPATKELCDERDRSQGHAEGELWAALGRHQAALHRLQAKHKDKLVVRYFTLQPYSAFTIVDDQLWIIPYITSTGYESMVVFLEKRRSAKLFDLYHKHFDRLVKTAIATPLDQTVPSATTKPVGLH